MTDWGKLGKCPTCGCINKWPEQTQQRDDGFLFRCDYVCEQCDCKWCENLKLSEKITLKYGTAP